MRVILLLWAAALAAAQPQTYVLKPTPKTVIFGRFDASVPPALRVRPGDSVAMESVMIADPAMMREGGIPDAAIRETDRVIHREVKDLGPGPVRRQLFFPVSDNYFSLSATTTSFA